MIHVKLKCKCGIKVFSTDKISKRDIMNSMYHFECNKCNYNHKILSVQNDRERKLEKILKGIN